MSDLHITILGSGSAGNCALVESRECRLLVDGGLSALQITRRLATVGVVPEQLDGILLTHEHSDHVAGIRVFCKKRPLPVYSTRLTTETLRRSALEGHPDVRHFHPGSDFRIKDIGIHAFMVPHDAVEPVGFLFSGNDGDSLGYLTDLGICTKMALERMRGVKTLLIETNHDEQMLQNDTRRPWSLKQRIMSRHGHLSNTAAAEVIAQLLSQGLQRAILGHLSRDCNTPELALSAVRTRLAAEGDTHESLEVHCAQQQEASPRFPVGRPTPVSC